MVLLINAPGVEMHQYLAMPHWLYFWLLALSFQFRLEIRQRRAHAGVRVTTVAGAEDVDDTGFGHVRRRIQPSALVVVLGVGRMQVSEGAVTDILGLAAPAVVDCPHTGIHQGAVHRLEVFGIGRRAKQEAVVGVGIAHVELCVVRHAVHAHAVAGCAHRAGDMGTVRIIVRVKRTGGAEGAAIDVTAAGADGVITIPGGLRMVGIEA
jgi:hypothetical protein